MAERIHKIDDSVMLYEDSRVSHVEPAFFEASHWPEAGVVGGYSGGRGNTLLVNHEGTDWVIKHYYRGGLIGRVLNDEFLFVGADRVRAFHEFRLLASAAADGLPVPKPVAARFVRHGLYYTNDLITERLPDVQPFSNRLESGPVDEQIWTEVGETIGRLHSAAYFHADLSAHNIQISGSDDIFLLDFDQGRKMAGPGGWQQRNLDRLLRSFRKIHGQGSIEFSDSLWQVLLAGYRRTAG